MKQNKISLLFLAIPVICYLSWVWFGGTSLLEQLTADAYSNTIDTSRLAKQIRQVSIWENVIALLLITGIGLFYWFAYRPKTMALKSLQQKTLDLEKTIKMKTQFVSANIADVAASIDNQNRKVNQASNAFQNIMNDNEEALQNMIITKNATEDVRKSSQVAAVEATTAIGAIDLLSRHIKESAKIIVEVKDASKNAHDLLGMIQTITQQTNLLALNAAVEAARAGEKGRGFNIVANEVRLLASKTGEATQKIEDIINSLASKSNSAVESMDNILSQAASGSESVQNAAMSLAEINGAIKQIDEMNAKLLNFMEENNHRAESTDLSLKQVSTMNQGLNDTLHEILDRNKLN